jgi:hypothetical protein
MSSTSPSLLISKLLAFPISLAFAATAFAQSTSPPAADGHWAKQQLTDNFWGEGATAADMNKDGKMDVIYGPYWFEGPDFKKRHLIYPDTQRLQRQLHRRGL